MSDAKGERCVRTILCSANIPDGHTISMAELVDGRFAVYVDRTLCGAKLWDSSQLNDCINAYLATKWEMQHPCTPEASLNW
jgi:hypothetical protein